MGTIYLPPYSPELNPIERFRLYIKQNILRDEVYDTIALLESTLHKFIPLFLAPQLNNSAMLLI
ncbi:hypothetical protein GO684_03790 [Wolbachia endosymbiont of Litomosoides brasiliensis]|nr:hypothetical protein [Wolbachia endosymbiont of Litomosoides brasiliensis]